MPHSHAAAKSLRQTKRHRSRNLTILQTVRKTIHDARRAIRLQKADDAKNLVQNAKKALDRAVAKGTVKKNTAARKKSRLQIALNGLARKQ